MSLTFVFVFQGGPIEPKAALLAASLYEYVGRQADLVAAVPIYEGVLPPTESGLLFLESLQIKTHKIDNPVDISYPIANKIAAMAVPSATKNTIFLDSDILCLRSIERVESVFESEFCARLADFREIPHSTWEEIHKELGIEPPEFVYKSMIKQDSMPMYFNSGVVGTNHPQALSLEWAKLARKLNQPERWPITRPFLDQICLPLAVKNLGLTVDFLTPNQHFSSALFPAKASAKPLFAHYHDSRTLVGDLVAGPIAESLLRKHPELVSILRPDPWLSLLRNHPITA